MQGLECRVPVTQLSARQREDVRIAHWDRRNLIYLFIGKAEMSSCHWRAEFASSLGGRKREGPPVSWWGCFQTQGLWPAAFSCPRMSSVGHLVQTYGRAEQPQPPGTSCCSAPAPEGLQDQQVPCPEVTGLFPLQGHHCSTRVCQPASFKRCRLEAALPKAFLLLLFKEVLHYSPGVGILPNRASEKESSRGQSGEPSTLPASSLCTACEPLAVLGQPFLKVCFQPCIFRFGRWKTVTLWVKSKSSNPQRNVLVTLLFWYSWHFAAHSAAWSSY